MNDQVDRTIDRLLILHNAAEPPVNCPKCKAELVQEYGPFAVATRSGKRMTDTFFLGGDFGYLCPGCATAVIHAPKLVTMLYGGPPKSGWRVGAEFVVMGLINLDAIPPEKAYVPLDRLEPLPLVPFHGSEKGKQVQPKKRPGKPKRRK
jgi:hypothetical protein